MLTQSENSGVSVSRRALVSLLSSLAVLSVAPLPAGAQPGDVESSSGRNIPEGLPLIYQDDEVSFYGNDSIVVIIDANESVTLIEYREDGSGFTVTLPDGVAHNVTWDEMGITYWDGFPLGEVLYKREEDDPVANGCTLLGSTKTTVDQASQQSRIILELLSFIPGPQSRLVEFASWVYKYLINNRKDLWLIIYNYYCDTPYPLLRKEVMVYADYACTQFLTKRVYEDRVPV